MKIFIIFKGSLVEFLFWYFHQIFSLILVILYFQCLSLLSLFVIIYISFYQTYLFIRRDSSSTELLFYLQPCNVPFLALLNFKMFLCSIFAGIFLLVLNFPFYFPFYSAENIHCHSNLRGQ